MKISRSIIVDTNIIFSALLKNSSKFAEILLNSECRFFACEFLYIELFKSKEKLVKLSKLENDEITKLLSLFLERIHFFKESHIAKEHRQQAVELCKDIDEKDTQHVALTLELDGLLWTGDKKLIKGLKERGFDKFFQAD